PPLKVMAVCEERSFGLSMILNRSAIRKYKSSTINNTKNTMRYIMFINVLCYTALKYLFVIKSIVTFVIHNSIVCLQYIVCCGLFYSIYWGYGNYVLFFLNLLLQSSAA